MLTEAHRQKEKQLTRRKPNKTALLVAGMHRSGTSALTRVLNILGYSLPRNVLPPNSTNETGHWEPKDIVHLNDEILAFAGTAWNDTLPLDVHGYDSSIIGSFRERALALLEREYGESQFFVLKDPRVCRLLPFWIEVVKAFDAEPVIIIPVRHPLEVAISLERRNGFDRFTGCLLWLRYILDSEANSRGHKRACLQYAALLDESRTAMEGLGHTLDLPWPDGPTNAWVEVERFLRPELRHHKAGGIQLSRSFTHLSWLETGWRICDKWSRDTIAQEDMAELDSIRIAFDKACPAFGSTLIEDLNRALVKSMDESEALQHTLEKRNKLVEELSNSLAEYKVDTTSLKRSLVAHKTEIFLHKRELKALYESKSWRITAPLRHARRTPAVLARSMWHGIPLPQRSKSRLKDTIFNTMPALFKHKAAYRNWKAAKNTGISTIAPSREMNVEGKNWGIMTPLHTLFVAKAIKRQLQSHACGVDVIIQPPPPEAFGHDFYVVICPQVFDKLPPSEKLIAYQMEQGVSDRWFDKRYLGILSNALCVLEYATFNFPYLQEKGIAYPHVYHLPIGGLPSYREAGKPKTRDVLFYGDNLSCPRRLHMLAILEQRFDVRIENNTYGSDIQDAIQSARVVVNLHYYENALLEVPRIWECLSLGTPVVSETAGDGHNYPELGNVVRFFEQDSYDAMLLAVEQALESPPSQDEIAEAVNASANRFSFMFDRFLVARGFLSNKDVDKMNLTIPKASDKILLSLPETFARRAAIQSEEKLTGWALFDGIRKEPPWVGCGLSYKIMARHALANGHKRITVAEDDVLLPEDFSKRFEIINRYLDGTKEWDIFAGLISDLRDDVEILAVEEYEGQTFVSINRMTSTVFNIYNHTALSLLAQWDADNPDVHSNTIDRFIENREGLKIIVTLPFFVGHKEKHTSSVWFHNNSVYVPLISASENRLKQMVSRFVREPRAPGAANRELAR